MKCYVRGLIKIGSKIRRLKPLGTERTWTLSRMRNKNNVIVHFRCLWLCLERKYVECGRLTLVASVTMACAETFGQVQQSPSTTTAICSRSYPLGHFSLSIKWNKILRHWENPSECDETTARYPPKISSMNFSINRNDTW